MTEEDKREDEGSELLTLKLTKDSLYFLWDALEHLSEVDKYEYQEERGVEFNFEAFEDLKKQVDCKMAVYEPELFEE